MTLYLINPARGGGKARKRRTTTRRPAMARKTPARNAKGRFVKGGTTKRKRRTTRAKAAPKRRTARKRRANPAPKRRTTRRRTSVARQSAPRRRRRTTRRRNPDILKQVKQGVMDAAAITVGKAAARMIPTMLPQLPKQGFVGLAVQAASAIAAGYLADRFASRDVARFILAGGLSAPLETAAIAYNVPLIGPALDPVTSTAAVAAFRGGAGVSGYVGRARRGGRIGAYVLPSAPVARPHRNGMGSYVTPGFRPGVM